MKNKLVKVFDLNQKEQSTCSYDKLILAMGAYPVLPLIKGDVPEHLFILKEFNDALRLGNWLARRKSVVILGGGAIGVELARVLNQRGLKVTLMSRSGKLMQRYLGDQARHWLENQMLKEGIKIINQDNIAEIKKEGSKIKLSTLKGEVLKTDGLVFTVGFRANTALVRGQLELDEYGAVRVDDYMRTSAADVFAAGDCVTTYSSLNKGEIYEPRASTAIRQGAIAAINLMEAKRKINSTQGTFVLEMGDMKITSVGLPLERAQAIGWNTESVYLENAYKGGFGLKMWLVYEKNTHQILGAQAFATTERASAFMDILSLAIERGLTVEDIEFTDFYLKHGFENPLGLTEAFAQLINEKEAKEAKDGKRINRR